MMKKQVEEGGTYAELFKIVSQNTAAMLGTNEETLRKLMNANLKDIEKYRKEIEKIKGDKVITEAYEAVMSDFTHQIGALSSQFKLLFYDFSKPVLDFASKALPYLIECIKYARDLLSALPKPLKDAISLITGMGVAVIGSVGAWKALVWVFGDTIKTSVGILSWIIKITNITKIWTATQLAFNAAMAANPIGLMIGLAVALGATAYLVIKHWDKVKEWWMAFGNLIVNLTTDGFKIIKNLYDDLKWYIYENLWKPIKDDVEKEWNELIVAPFKNTYNWVKEKFGELTDLIMEPINKVIKKIPRWLLPQGLRQYQDKLMGRESPEERNARILKGRTLATSEEIDSAINNGGFERQRTPRGKVTSSEVDEMINNIGTEPKDLGDVTKQFESGNRGTSAISSGYGDPGGVSYGTYQLSSSKGTLGDFLNSPEGKGYKNELLSSGPVNSEGFKGKWLELAKDDNFKQAEHDYIKRTHYDPAILKAKKLGFKTEDKGIQEAVWSASVQHGGVEKVLEGAARQKGFQNMSAQDQLAATSQARKNYVNSLSSLPSTTKVSLMNRYNREYNKVSGYKIKNSQTPPVVEEKTVVPETSMNQHETIKPGTPKNPELERIGNLLDQQNKEQRKFHEEASRQRDEIKGAAGTSTETNVENKYNMKSLNEDPLAEKRNQNAVINSWNV